MFAQRGRGVKLPETGSWPQVALSKQGSTRGPESAVWGTAGIERRPAPFQDGLPGSPLYASAVWGMAPVSTAFDAYRHSRCA